MLSSVIPVSDVPSQTFEARLYISAQVAYQFLVGQLVSVAFPIAAASLSHVVHRDALVLGKNQHAVFTIQPLPAQKTTAQSQTPRAQGRPHQNLRG